MLTGNKSISFNYQSMVGETPVVYMTGQIPESGKSTCTKTIMDLELYEANKAECRKDIAAFDAIVWEAEDGFKVETPVETPVE